MNQRKEFMREERYIVVKIKDIENMELEGKLRHMIKNDLGCDLIDGVVTESHWPNHEHVWKTTEQIANGEWSEGRWVWQAATEQGAGEAFGRFDGWAGGSDGRCQLSVFMDSDVTLLERGAKLYTHKPKPTGGGVPDVGELIEKLDHVLKVNGPNMTNTGAVYVEQVRATLLATQQPPEQDTEK